MPSGHSQAAAVIAYCAVDVLRQTAVSRTLLRMRGLLLWAGFVLAQAAMWTSRLYISAHFPHQCVLGCLVGLLVVRSGIEIRLCYTFTPQYSGLVQGCVHPRLLGAAAGGAAAAGGGGAAAELAGGARGAGGGRPRPRLVPGAGPGTLQGPALDIRGHHAPVRPRQVSKGVAIDLKL